MQRTFHGYVQPPRPGAAPGPTPHADRRRLTPPATARATPRNTPGRHPATTSRATPRKLLQPQTAVLLAALLAPPSHAQADAAGPPGAHTWPMSALDATTTTTAGTTTSTTTPTNTSADPAPAATATAAVLAASTTLPTAAPLAIKMTATPVRHYNCTNF